MNSFTKTKGAAPRMEERQTQREAMASEDKREWKGEERRGEGERGGEREGRGEGGRRGEWLTDPVDHGDPGAEVVSRDDVSGGLADAPVEVTRHDRVRSAAGRHHRQQSAPGAHVQAMALLALPLHLGNHPLDGKAVGLVP